MPRSIRTRAKRASYLELAAIVVELRAEVVHLKAKIVELEEEWAVKFPRNGRRSELDVSDSARRVVQL